MPLADDVDLDVVAAATPGMVGAELPNLVNEAAILAARRGHTQVHQADFTDALEKIVLGSERRILLSAEDGRRTAYHEAGHALLGMLTPGADPVRKISIVPRGHALGRHLPVPRRRPLRLQRQLPARAASPARWAAGPPRSSSTATSPPVPRTTSSRPPASPSRWSAAGACREADRDGVGAARPAARAAPRPGRRRHLAGHPGAGRRPRSAASSTRATTRPCQTLRANRDRLDALVEALLRTETLDAADAYRAAGVPYPAEPDVPAQAPDVVRH